MKSIFFFSTVTHHFPCESSWKWKHMLMTSLQLLSDWLADDGTANPLLRHSVVSHTWAPPREHTVSQENPWSGLNVTTTVTLHHQTEENVFLPYYMCAKQNLCPETIRNNNLNMMHKKKLGVYLPIHWITFNLPCIILYNNSIILYYTIILIQLVLIHYSCPWIVICYMSFKGLLSYFQSINHFIKHLFTPTFYSDPKVTKCFIIKSRQ